MCTRSRAAHGALDTGTVGPPQYLSKHLYCDNGAGGPYLIVGGQLAEVDQSCPLHRGSCAPPQPCHPPLRRYPPERAPGSTTLHPPLPSAMA
jgi:hypothetical protein